MQKEFTISVDEQVYEGLQRVVGGGNISQFIEDLVRPHVLRESLDAAYAAMARDEAREVEAAEWAEGLIGDANDAAR
jgi:predicted CopG family antitoxin